MGSGMTSHVEKSDWSFVNSKFMDFLDSAIFLENMHSYSQGFLSNMPLHLKGDPVKNQGPDLEFDRQFTLSQM